MDAICMDVELIAALFKSEFNLSDGLFRRVLGKPDEATIVSTSGIFAYLLQHHVLNRHGLTLQMFQYKWFLPWANC